MNKAELNEKLNTNNGDNWLRIIDEVTTEERSLANSRSDFLVRCSLKLRITYPETFLRVYWDKFVKV